MGKTLVRTPGRTRFDLMAPKLLSKAKEKGLRDSLTLGLSLTRGQIRSLRRRTAQQYVFVAPPIDNTGAPQVLVNLIEETAQQGSSTAMRLFTSDVSLDQRRRLARTGVHFERAASVLGPRLLRLQLAFKQSDFVVMNSAAVPENYRGAVLDALEAGRLELAYWLIHEDVDQIPIVAPDLLAPDLRGRLVALLDSDRLRLFVPSRATQRAYAELLGTEHIRLSPLRVDVAGMEPRVRENGDYARIDFLLTGTAADGRKGQLFALFAFQQFLATADSTAGLYRDFTLTCIGIGDDHISRQCRVIGSSVLGDRFRVFAPMPRAAALEVESRCNAAICCSMNEAFPLYIAEGMAFGHVLLRNRVGGFDEQIIPGLNGFEIDSADIVQFSEAIEKVLNRAAFTDADLQRMGAESQALIAPYRNISYLTRLRMN